MTINMIIITVILSLASATRQYACDEDAARALKRPWAPVVFHGERETESLPEIDARFTPDGDADEAAGFRAVDAFNPLLAAARGALSVDVGAHGRVAPVRRLPLDRERRDGWWAVAREDPGGRERGLPLVHLTCAYQSSSSEYSSSSSSASSEYSSPSDEAAGSGWGAGAGGFDARDPLDDKGDRMR